MITQTLKDRVEPIQSSELIPWERDLVNDVFVIDATKYYKEYTPFMQVYTGGSGFGSQLGKMGTKLYCTELHTESRECLSRNDVIGILPFDKIFEYFEKPYEVSKTLHDMYTQIAHNRDFGYFAPDSWDKLVREYHTFLQEVAEGEHLLTLECNDQIKELYWKLATDDKELYDKFSSALPLDAVDSHSNLIDIPNSLLPTFYALNLHVIRVGADGELTIDERKMPVAKAHYMMHSGVEHLGHINRIKMKVKGSINSKSQAELEALLTEDELNFLAYGNLSHGKTGYNTYNIALLDAHEINEIYGFSPAEGVSIKDLAEYLLLGNILRTKTLTKGDAVKLITRYLEESVRLGAPTMVPVEELELFLDICTIYSKEYPDNNADDSFYSDPLDLQRYPIVTESKSSDGTVFYTGNHAGILKRLMPIAVYKVLTGEERDLILSAIHKIKIITERKPTTLYVTVNDGARDLKDVIELYLKISDAETKEYFTIIHEQLSKLVTREIKGPKDGGVFLITLESILNEDLATKEFIDY